MTWPLMCSLSLFAACMAVAQPRSGRPASAASSSRGERPELVDPLPKASGPVAPAAPPANAEKLPDGGYRSKDSSGAIWIWRQTPFGWARAKEAELAVPSTPAPPPPDITVLGLEGDLVRFRRPNPFGDQTWTRSRPELSAEESDALRRYGSQPSAAATKASDAAAAKTATGAAPAPPASHSKVQRLEVTGASSNPKPNPYPGKESSKEKK